MVRNAALFPAPSLATKEEPMANDDKSEPTPETKRTFILDISKLGFELNAEELRAAVGACNPGQDPCGSHTTYTATDCRVDPDCDPLVC